MIPYPVVTEPILPDGYLNNNSIQLSAVPSSCGSSLSRLLPFTGLLPGERVSDLNSMHS